MGKGTWHVNMYNWILPGGRRQGQPKKLWKEGILQAVMRGGLEPRQCMASIAEVSFGDGKAVSNFINRSAAATKNNNEAMYQLESINY
jgi:hypothetical protein